MALSNLNERFLYALLPSAVVATDSRAFLDAVLGGLQDRICDFRSQASQLNDLIDPSAVHGSYLSSLVVVYTSGVDQLTSTLNFNSVAPPLGNLSLGDFAAQTLGIDPSNIISVAYSADSGSGLTLFNTVQITYVGPQGNQIARSLDIDPTTPLDDAGLTSWAVAQCNLDPDVNVVSVVYGTDVLRQVDANTIQLLASTVGASVYRSLGSTNPIEDARRVVEGYFPRLRVKGTGLSFELLGRLIGFDDAAFVPLWGRLSPRFPSDLGNVLNDSDFAAQPQVTPTATLPSPTYDPNDLTDGDQFYHYESATVSGTLLTVDPSSTFYIPNAINGQNPFFTVEATQPTLTLPQTGEYTLQGGGPHVTASVQLGTSGFKALALTEGASFNGLVIKVQQDLTGTIGVNFETIGRLSSIKYRTSYYDVRLAIDATRFATDLNGTIPVTPNPDLAVNPTLDVGDEYLSFNGTAQTPYRPWKSGVLPLSYVDPFYGTSSGTNPYTGSWPATQFRVAAVPGRLGDPELDLTALANLGNQATAYLEDVRPATRSPRRSLTGLLVRDTVPYAPFNGRYLLFTTTGATGTFSGTVPAAQGTDGYPLAPYTASFVSGTNALGVESDYADSNILRLRGTGLSGTYLLNTNSYSVVVSPEAGTNSVYAIWSPLSTDLIRPEPSAASKTAYYTPSSRPEDILDAPGIGFFDDYPWRRGIKAGGATIDLNTVFNGTYDKNAVRYSGPAVVIDNNGVTSTVNVHDLSDSVQPYRLDVEPIVTTQDVTSAPIYSAAQLSYAQLLNTGDTYSVGAVGTVLFADASSFTEENHTTGLVGWWPMNEHPLDDLTVIDQSPDGRVNQNFSGNINPSDRVWDVQRGWVLNLHSGNSWSSNGFRDIFDKWSMGIWLRADPKNSGSTASNILTYGSVSLTARSNSQTTVTLSVNGTNFPSSGTLPLNGAWAYYVASFNGSTIGFDGGTFNGSMTEIGAPDLNTTNAYLNAPLSSDDTVTVGGGPVSYFASDFRIWNTLPNQNIIRRPNVVPTKVVEVTTVVQNSVQTQSYALFVNPESYRVYPGPLPRYFGPDSFGTNYQKHGFDEDDLADAIRYDGFGAYTADPAYKQVGYGGGETTRKSVLLGDGELSAKFTGDGSAVSNSPVTSPAYVTGAVSGTDNLRAWFRADLEVTADARSRVTAWTDTVSGFTVSGTSGTSPFLEVVKETGHFGVSMKAGTSGLSSSGSSSGLNGNSTIIFAGSFSPLSSHTLLGAGAAPNTRSFGVSSTSMTIISNGSSTASSSAVTGGRGIYTWTINGTQANFYFNGTSYGSSSVPVVNGTTGISFGVSPDGLRRMGGSIYETISFASPLSDSKRVQIETYLADKFGLYYPTATWLNSYSSNVRTVATSFMWSKIQTDEFMAQGFTGNETPVGFEGNTNTGKSASWSVHSPYSAETFVVPPFTGTGGVTFTGSFPSPSGLWPSLSRLNPDTDRVYVRGDNGRVYQLSLENDNPAVGTYIKPTIPFTPRPSYEVEELSNFTLNPDLSLAPRNGTNPVPLWLDQTTDVVSIVGDATGILAVNPGNGTNPYVYVMPPGTSVPAPITMYLTHEAVINTDQNEVFNRWEQATSTPPTYNGNPVAAITSGNMSFTNSEALESGKYRITVDTANLGTLDSDFHGFNVEIGFGDDNPVIPATLMPNGTGTSSTASDTFDLTLPLSVGGIDGWTLTINWLNPRAVPERSQLRKLAILGYRIDRLATNVYTITPSTGTTNNFLTRITNGTSYRGGWGVSLDSGGNITTSVHESAYIARSAAPNDTASDLLIPAIDLLTGSTNERAEDLRVSKITDTRVLTLAQPGAIIFNGTFPVYGYSGSGYIPVDYLNWGGAVAPVRLSLADATKTPAPPTLPDAGSPIVGKFYLNGSLYSLWHY